MKIKTMLVSLLCAACLQAPMMVQAVELPFIPVEEMQADSISEETGTSDDAGNNSVTDADTQQGGQSEIIVMNDDGGSAEAVSKAENEGNDNEELPIIASENIEQATSASAEESSVSQAEGDVSESTSASAEDKSTYSEPSSPSSVKDNSENAENGEKSSLHVIIAVVCGVVVAAAVLTAVLRKGKK